MDQLPDFIGIGTPKAATTWLYTCLSEHPDICMSRDKEVDFFLSENYDKGLSWYIDRFLHCDSDVVRGEYSPNYFYDEQAPERIKQDVPNAKLVLILRNPVDRFFSAVRFEHARGRYGTTPLEEILAQSNERNFDRGRYAKHLSRWLQHFPKERIHILMYEDVMSNPAQTIKDVFGFLGVDDAFSAPSTHSSFNVTTRSSAGTKRLKSVYYGGYRFLSKYPLLVQLLKSVGVSDLVKNLLTPKKGGVSQKEEISHEIRTEIQQRYDPEIEKLETLLGTDLSMWRART